MTVYDAVMAALVVAGMVWGAWRGIIWQLASICLPGARLLGSRIRSRPQLRPPASRRTRGGAGLAMLVIYAAVSGGIFLAAWLAPRDLATG